MKKCVEPATEVVELNQAGSVVLTSGCQCSPVEEGGLCFRP